MLHIIRTEENYDLEDGYEEYRCVTTYRQVQSLQILIKPSSDATWLTNYPCDGRIPKNLLSTDDSLTLRRLMSYIYIYIYIYMEHLFLMFLDHTQRRSTVGRTPLDE